MQGETAKSFAELFYEEQKEALEELGDLKIKVPDHVKQERRAKNKAARKARKKNRV